AKQQVRYSVGHGFSPLHVEFGLHCLHSDGPVAGVGLGGLVCAATRAPLPNAVAPAASAKPASATPPYCWFSEPAGLRDHERECRPSLQAVIALDPRLSLLRRLSMLSAPAPNAAICRSPPAIMTFLRKWIISFWSAKLLWNETAAAREKAARAMATKRAR